MVSKHVALLSLAAASSAMLGRFRVERHEGRFPRILAFRNETSGPPAAETSSIISTSSASSTSTGSSGPPPQQLIPEPTGTHYPYPPEYGTGEVSTAYTNVPTNPAVPSQETRPPSTGTKPDGPPPADGDAGGISSEKTPPVIFKPSITRQPPGLGVKPTLPTPGQGSTATQTWDMGVGVPSSATTEIPTSSSEDPSAAWSRTRFNNMTWTWNTSTHSTTTTSKWTPPTPIPGEWSTAAPTVSFCEQSDLVKPVTSYITVFTWTTTWEGDPTDYTPPFAEPTAPPVITSCINPKVPQQLTLSRCLSTGTAPEHKSCQSTMITGTYGINKPWEPTSSGPTEAPTYTVITTAKNPSVAYSTSKMPDYGGETPNSRDIHKPAQPTPGDGIGMPVEDPRGGNGGQKQPPPEKPPVTVVVPPDYVIIDDKTFSDSPQFPTQVVTVNRNTFTINPSQVIGVGTTIDRPPANVPQTTTTVNNIAVTINPPGSGGGGGGSGGSGGSGSPSNVAVVDGTTYQLPTPGAPSVTSVVRGETVVFGPSAVVVGEQTVRITPAPQATSIVIAGGELITAIGQSVVVVKGTTITYGPSMSSVTVIDQDTFTIGPMGVTVHGTVLGGPSARMSDTQLEIVGGATITQVGGSVVVIQGSSYTVGPGQPTRTVMAGGETITLGPSGVSIATVTMSFPFGRTTVITPGSTPTAALASETQSKDAGTTARPDWFLSLFLTCIAIGVRVFGTFL